ncbi:MULTISPECIES: LacI family DNA-binding transcriptional regulator [Halomonas]|uniref:LacI family DNA-binding transcriptional regulator n=1 Tax=Halomonas TaxID=2745 RepID=UPI001C97C599|nr:MULTISPECIES: LacI family DNA-binding transcriptional regulator [Halomonas]MBY6208639.1 LacI family DNA-binding transcriptional regulator [Halomonas sp. DP3Y7-2]MBY6227110.1 LacI family DNA-binding transcriptional regulator [Halomonas sp. DP3Y7-1]MCA0915141.1 LacI family DNA-binding transcriptional regulator [Halomonas denitrificans]
MKPSVKDVAALANVSTATVSRTFNTPDIVNEEVRQRVLEAANQLGYYSNAAARALRHRRTRMIATMLPKLDDAIYAEAANGIQQTLSEKGYVGILETSGFNNKKLSDRGRHLIERGAEGLLVFGRIDDEELLNHLKNFKIPVISLYSYLGEGEIPSIGIDNYTAAEQIANHIYDLNHQRVLMISGPTRGNDRQQHRIQAFQDVTTKRHGHSIVHEIDKDYSIDDAKAAFKEAFSRWNDVTACICNSDIIAFGVLLACREMNINVPERLSVTGFDDINFSTLLNPPLTTVSVPVAEIGRSAALAMVEHLEHGLPIASRCIPSPLMKRESTMAISDSTIGSSQLRQ